MTKATDVDDVHLAEGEQMRLRGYRSATLAVDLSSQALTSSPSMPEDLPPSQGPVL
ncbi:hypothetical protein [Streptomyces tendae]|uniref:hypothetical protein n=1 Tax=Streptomyces tendae TaxID=1932 RepID=UPI00369ADF05